MGYKAICTIFNSVFIIYEVPSALLAHGIERAIAKKTVKALCVRVVAREIFALCVFEISTAVRHNEPPFTVYSNVFFIVTQNY